MYLDFYQYFYYICLGVSSIIAVAFLKKKPGVFSGICLLIILTLLSELAAKLIVIWGFQKTNSVVYHVFTPVEFGMYAVIFAGFFASRKWNRMLICFSAFLLTAEILNTIWWQPLSRANTNIMILESVLLVFLSLVLFIKIREMPMAEDILKSGIFWFSTAALFYYAFNILIWGFHNIKVYNLENPPTIIYNVNQIFSGILYLVYACAIYLNYRSQRN